MNVVIRYILCLAASISLFSCEIDAPTPSSRPEPKQRQDDDAKSVELKIYLGNLHSHSQYSADATQTGNEPSDHFSLAKSSGYRFYAVTDHSQYDLSDTDVPESTLAARWAQILKEANDATDTAFVALRGYEYSENNGPGAKGHLNVFNSSTYLNALADGIDMKYFHDWISSSANSSIVVCMNHPSANQYSDFACYNETARKRVCLIELINAGSCNDHYPGYLAALAKGWKVSPVAGSDLHGTNKVATWPARTGIAAEKLTKESLLEAMRERRTFAAYDKTLKVLYYVNDKPMGTSFSSSVTSLDFSIEASCTTQDIKRIDICAENGAVITSKAFNGKNVSWQVNVARNGHKYMFVNIYGTDASKALAYAAPVWFD